MLVNLILNLHVVMIVMLWVVNKSILPTSQNCSTFHFNKSPGKAH